MAVHYSDHFGTGVDIQAIVDPRTVTSAGKKHASKRIARAEIDMGASTVADGEVCRLLTLKSGDRIFSIKDACDGSGTALTTVDLGIYLTGDNNDGAAVDIDLFGAALDCDVGYALTERVLTGSQVDEDTGKTLWELLDLNAATLTEDPLVEYDLCYTYLNGVTVGALHTVIVEYTSSA